jgi:hypothetical protein
MENMQFESRRIQTNLHGKEEVFKLMALGESLGIPVLLVGVPGVAKTQAMLDYAASVEGGLDNAFEKSFVIELDEGTRPSEIRGMIDLEKLHIDKKFDVITPIADAKYVMINEVDKATSGVRNTMLSAMRERALMLGKSVRKCKWSLFVGTCNKINDDPDEAPYWDRWMLKLNVPRVTTQKLADSWMGQTYVDVSVYPKGYIESFVPKDEPEFQKCISEFLNIYFEKMTDRTAWHIPLIIKGCHLVYGTDMVEATIKAASLLCADTSLLKTLASRIEDKGITTVKTEIGRLTGVIDSIVFSNISATVTKFIQNEAYSQDKRDGIKELYKRTVENNPQAMKIWNEIKEQKKKDKKVDVEKA